MSWFPVDDVTHGLGVEVTETERTLYNGYSVFRTEAVDEPLIDAIRSSAEVSQKKSYIWGKSMFKNLNKFF